jgi:hypothetical protein
MKRCVVLSLVLGCASTIAGTGGDAGDGGDAAMEAAVPPTNLDLTVLLWPRTPGVPGAGGQGRAQAEDGTFVEADTGADGHLRMNLDPTKRYDVTVAVRAYQVVSLVGVRVPFQSTVRLMPQDTGLRPLDAMVHTRAVSYTGRASESNRVDVEGGFSHLMQVTTGSELVVEDWSGAPPLSLAAIEFDGERGTRPVNARWFPSVPRGLNTPFVVDFPSPPTPAQTGASVLEFPAVGLVTGAMTWRAVRTFVIQRKYTATGDRPAFVGTMLLEPPTVRTAARMIVTSFDGPLRPQWVIATLRADNAPGDTRMRDVTVATRPPFAGLAVAIPPVQELAARYDSSMPGDPRPDGVRAVRLDADTAGWHRAAFVAGTSPLWEGFAVDGAPWRDRALPALPSRYPAAAIFGGTPPVRTCLLRDDPNATEPPWAMAPLVDTEGAASLGRSLLRVCSSEPR